MRRARRLAAASLTVVIAVALVASASAAGGRTVTLQGLAFTPTTVKIKAGQSVTFRWKDSPIPHNVTSSRFKSAKTRKTGSYTVRFAKKGTYPFRCTIHPTMKGKIVVS